MGFVRSISAAMLALTVGSSALAADTATDILRKVDQRDRGDDLTLTLDIVLTDRNGDRRTRTGKIYRITKGQGESEQITVFLSPQNIRNTALWTIDADDSDFMWLYLPALRKAKRVPPADRGAKFVGTDLSNEDLKLGFEYEDYHAELIGEEVVDGIPIASIRLEPKTDNLKRELGFEHSIAKVRTDIYYMVDHVTYERGEVKKRFFAGDIEKIDGVWTALRLGAVDVINDHDTMLIVTEAKYNRGLSKSFFSRRTLTRGIYR